MSGTKPIRVSVADSTERRRRQRELWLAAATVVVLLAMSWVEFTYVGVDSYLFVILLNVNFLLMLGVTGVVVRNVVKLLLERRRKVLGSQLRTRLVVAFATLSLMPTLLMFFLAVKVLRTSVDYWFTAQVETAMEDARRVGQLYVTDKRDGLADHARFIVDEMRRRRLAAGSREMESLLLDKAGEYGLSLAGLLTQDGRETGWSMHGAWREAWPELRKHLDLQAIGSQPSMWSSILPGNTQDLLIGVMPVDNGRVGYLVLGKSLGKGVKPRLDQVVRGAEEFRNLRVLKYPLKVVLYLALGVMTMLILLAAVWFGFRIAKELSKPIQALAMGTQRIAQGDLSVRLEDQAGDELGLLVQSFNRMAEDLEVGQDHLKEANRRLEQKNQELNDHYRYMEAVLDNITAGVVSVDRHGRIGTVNKAAQAMLGLDRRQLVGKSVLKLLRGEYAEIVREILDRLELGLSTHWQRRVDIRLAGMEVTYLVTVVVLRTEEGQEAGLVAVFDDVGEMERMQRVSAWREVARRIAHEIKNPLTPIKLSAQRLERKFSSQVEDPAFLEATQLIVRQVEQMQRMVSEFSAFAKLPEVSLKSGRVEPLVEEVLGTFRTSHSNIAWELRIADELPPIRFDAEGLRRVLMNVLTNSADALDGQADALVRVTVSHDRLLSLVLIEVADNGPGLTEHERSRMFEPYFTRKKGGTGLGLTIVKSIVSDHGGFVRVRPNSPTGTVVVLELPV